MGILELGQSSGDNNPPLSNTLSFLPISQIFQLSKTSTVFLKCARIAVEKIGMDFTTIPSFMITDEFLLEIVKRLRAKKFVIPFAQRLTDSGLIQALEDLKEISLEGNLKFASDRLMDIIALKNPNLEAINLSGCIKTSFQGLKTLIYGCSNLKVLKVGSMNKLAVNGEFLKLLEKTNIHTLGLNNCLLQDQDMVILAEALNSKLFDLDLSYCESIKDEGIQMLVRKCQNIRRLKLYGLPEISDASLSQLGSLSNLQDLDLSMCVKITDSGIENLVKAGSLRHLKLYGCKFLTSESLRHISKYCRHLKSISLYGNDQINEVTVMDLLLSCKNLHSLDLGSCKNISREFARKANQYR
jgi:hypothetical protein